MLHYWSKRGVSWKLRTIVSAITPSGHALNKSSNFTGLSQLLRRRINYPFLHNIAVYQPSNYVNNAAGYCCQKVLWLTLFRPQLKWSNSNPSVSWAIISIIQSSAASESPRYALVPPPIQPSPGNQTWWIFWSLLGILFIGVTSRPFCINSNSVKSVLDDRAQDSVMKLIFPLSNSLIGSRGTWSGILDLPYPSSQEALSGHVQGESQESLRLPAPPFVILLTIDLVSFRCARISDRETIQSSSVLQDYVRCMHPAESNKYSSSPSSGL